MLTVGCGSSDSDGGSDADADTDMDADTDGYTCQPFNGIVVSYSCQIICTEDCECPDDGTCVENGDKYSDWMECSYPVIYK